MRGVPCLLFGVSITLLAACDRQSGPSTLAPTWVSATTVSVWDVRTMPSGITIADPCFIQPAAEASPMTVSVIRTDDRIAFAPDGPPDEPFSATGTVDGNDFATNSAPWPTNERCPDGTVVTGTFVMNVTGRFSDDGRHLTAKESVTYRFPSGESTLRFDWSGVER
jgi:hypothetical protein